MIFKRILQIMAFSMGCPLLILGCSDNSPAIYDGSAFQQGFSSWSAPGSSDSGMETDGGAVVFYADSLTLTMSDGSQKIFRNVYYWFEGGKFWTSSNVFEYVAPPVPADCVSWVRSGSKNEVAHNFPVNLTLDDFKARSHYSVLKTYRVDGKDIYYAEGLKIVTIGANNSQKEHGSFWNSGVYFYFEAGMWGSHPTYPCTNVILSCSPSGTY
ncbi:MAG: hypothetical protein IJL80_01795 [Treponema sp.]|nr:hypothetical protein [Treponema sp.]